MVYGCRQMEMTVVKCAVVFFVCLTFGLGGCSQSGSDWVEKKAKAHPCRRPCKEGKTMTCFYKFSVEWYYAMSKACYECPNKIEDCYREDCIPVDGKGRTIMTVNKQLPGPAIEVCKGDKVIVDVSNDMNDESTSIHWHGHHQVRSPYMDGVPLITQCPISPYSVFRYTMEATNSGTHLWHSHTGVQRGDGVFGPLVVRIPDSQNPLKDLYDQDLSEHTIIINDWTHITTTDKLQFHLQSTGNNKPDSILINGKGRWYNDSVPLTRTPLAVFTVKQGLRYRFRLINSGLHNCPMELLIDHHNLTAIASDGDDFDPVPVQSINSFAGERFDFILNASQPVDNYWFRITGQMDCDQRFNKVHQLAVLHYEGAPLLEPTAAVGYKVHPKSKMQLNPLNVPLTTPGVLFIPKLNATLKPRDPELLANKTDVQIFLPFDFSPIDQPMYHKPGVYGLKQVNETYQRFTPQFNYISFKMPQSPLLSQFDDVDPDIFCDPQDTKYCETHFCQCLYSISIPTNSTVELILIDKGVKYNANHPFHLHGYTFRVVGMDQLGDSVDPALVKALDREGKLIRDLEHPPWKDTVTVPDGGYTILRFRATNPGFWLLHCHIDAHVEVGMAVVFKIGELDECPAVPQGFPKCGNFMNKP